MAPVERACTHYTAARQGSIHHSHDTAKPLHPPTHPTPLNRTQTHPNACLPHCLPHICHRA